jgi:phage-Barnase-EndoU-ColicinE5/D-RelE like nuclease2
MNGGTNAFYLRIRKTSLARNTKTRFKEEQHQLRKRLRYSVRARHLRSARETLESPDEVWAENPRVTSAKWVYSKEYDSKPYAFSVALVGEWETNSTIIVPFSSFPCEKKNVKKWRQSKKIYP